MANFWANGHGLLLWATMPFTGLRRRSPTAVVGNPQLRYSFARADLGSWIANNLVCAGAAVVAKGKVPHRVMP